MKSIARYIPIVGILLATLGLASCQDDFDGREPAFEAPVATHQANMSILDLKKMYWHEPLSYDNESLNYCDTIGFMPGTEKEHIYIAGRVISNDSEGNIFKSLIIQDATAALAISINQNDLYLQYRPGQEIVIDVTGMYIGKYRGLMQLGLPKFDESRGVYAASFMPIEFFRMHAECNGFPEPEKIDTLTFNNFDEFTSITSENLMKYQSQLVRLNNVYFPAANGTEVFSQYKSSGVDRELVDANDNKLVVRTSGYSNFWNKTLPQGNGDVVAIMSYYASNEKNSGYQLLLNNYEGCMNFGNPTVPKGLTADNPYTVYEAITLEDAGTAANAWVTGYIVGAVSPGVETVTSSNDIEWTSEVTLANSIVIAPTPDTKDIAACLVVPLTMGTSMRTYANLVDHPENYGKQMWIKGAFEKYMDTWAIVSQGAATDYLIDGVEIPGGGGGSTTGGDGSEANPLTVAQVIAKNPGSTTEAVATGVWVEGYIVGTIPTGGTSTVISGAVFGLDNAAASNLVLAPTPDCTDYTRCIAIQLPSGSTVRSQLNLVDNPGMLQAHVAIKGDVMKYCGGPGIKNTAECKVLSGGSDNPGGGGDNPGGGDTPSGLGTEAAPISVAAAIAAYNAGTTGNAWVEGYIVGTFTGTTADTAKFGADEASETNLILAPSADCVTASLCVAVQLPKGDIRNALNLKANPNNLGRHVKINGNLEKYFNGAGIKSTAVYSFY